MAVNNTTILEKSWLAGTNDYQQRVPEPTQQNIAATIDALFAPQNNDLWNQWSANIINMIGMTYVKQQSFRNPLGDFKKERLQYGKSIRRIVPKWFKAHSYKDDSETLLRMEHPDFEQWFVTVNRQDRYDATITRTEARQAMADEYGLNALIAGVMDAVINSDEYDEMQIMINLLAQFDAKFPLFREHLTAAPTDKETAQELLQKVRAYVGKLKFPSTLYNAIDAPVFVKPDELIFVTTPDVTSVLDVYALAELFHMDKAEIKTRIVEIPEFPIANVYGMLTSIDWFDCHDTEYGMYNFFNPETLSTKNYMHHQGIYAVNPAVPAILFTTDAATVPATITQAVTGLTISPATATASAGDEVPLTLTLTGTVTDNDAGIEVEPDSATFAIESTGGLNSRTFVDRFGVLHIQKTGLDAGDTVTVTATATYVNPSGTTGVYQATAVVTIE